MVRVLSIVSSKLLPWASLPYFVPTDHYLAKTANAISPFTVEAQRRWKQKETLEAKAL